MWNLAVEQHRHWRPGRKSAPGYLEQCRRLTRVRAEHPWLAPARRWCSSRPCATSPGPWRTARPSLLRAHRGTPARVRRRRPAGATARRARTSGRTRSVRPVTAPSRGDRARPGAAARAPPPPRCPVRRPRRWRPVPHRPVDAPDGGAWHLAASVASRWPAESTSRPGARSRADRRAGIRSGTAPRVADPDHAGSRCRGDRLHRTSASGASRRTGRSPAAGDVRARRSAIAPVTLVPIAQHGQVGVMREARLGEPAAGRQRDPELHAVQAGGPLRRGFLRMGDPAAGGHQVELAGADQLLAAEAVPVQHQPAEQPARRLQAGVRVRRHLHARTGAHVVGPVVVEEAPGTDGPQRPAAGAAGAPRCRLPPRPSVLRARRPRGAPPGRWRRAAASVTGSGDGSRLLMIRRYAGRPSGRRPRTPR